MISEHLDQTTPHGTPIHLNFRKFNGAEHWQEDYTLLGVDADGVWLGMPAGTTYARPDLTQESSSDTVRLVPHDDRWASAFNAPDESGATTTSTYVDITTPVQWQRTDAGFTGTLIDLDLDIIERFTGETFIDDEDEFEEHTVLFGYPDDLVRATRDAADRVLAAVRAGSPPFDGRADGWLAKVAQLPGVTNPDS